MEALKIFYTIILFFGLVANILVVLSISLIKHLRTRTNLLVLSLAIADILAILASPYICLYSEKVAFGRDAFHCPLHDFIAICSIYHLVAISLERCNAILDPFSVNYDTSKLKQAAKVGSVWCLTLLAGIFYKLLVIVCDTSLQRLIHTVFDTVVFVVVPVIIMAYCYWQISSVLWNRPKMLLVGCSLEVYRNQRVQATRCIKTFILLIAAILFCWLPFIICSILCLTEHSVSEVPILKIITTMLTFLNSCANPFAYSLMSKKFREGHKTVIRKICQRFSSDNQSE